MFILSKVPNCETVLYGIPGGGGGEVTNPTYRWSDISLVLQKRFASPTCRWTDIVCVCTHVRMYACMYVGRCVGEWVGGWACMHA